MDSAYLKATVGDALAEGLAAVVALQPSDPVAELGGWLHVKAAQQEQEAAGVAAKEEAEQAASAAAEAAEQARVLKVGLCRSGCAVAVADH